MKQTDLDKRPAWNCVDSDGPHYVGTPDGSCGWCGKSSETIRLQRQGGPGVPAFEVVASNLSGCPSAATHQPGTEKPGDETLLTWLGQDVQCLIQKYRAWGLTPDQVHAAIAFAVAPF